MADLRNLKGHQFLCVDDEALMYSGDINYQSFLFCLLVYSSSGRGQKETSELKEVKGGI